MNETSQDELGEELKQLKVSSDCVKFSESQWAIINYGADFNELLAVKAGPGSGKTLTIARRIGRLLEDGMKPEDILVLSMTNRAVSSLKNQLADLIDNDQIDNLHMSTFHSFCGSLIDNYGALIDPNYSKKTLIDDQSWRNFSDIFLAKSISLHGTNVKGRLTPPKLEKLLHGIKTGEFSIENAASEFKVSLDYIRELMNYLESHGMIRYLDLITDALQMMETTSKMPDKNSWIPQVARYKAVFVDEFQDMHYLLLKIVKAVINYPTYDRKPNEIKHLTISGDPNQCIYGFLGSLPGLMDNLNQEFPGMIISQLSIKESFRLTPEILKVATEVALKSNNLKVEDFVYSTKLPTYKPIIYSKDSSSQEYSFIVQEIARLIFELEGLLKPCDFIVLSRTNQEVDDICTYLESCGFKSNVFSLTNPWIKSKVHVFLDILNVINQGPGSDFSLLCVIKQLDPQKGSRFRLSKLFTASENWGLSMEGKSPMLESYIVNRGNELNNIYKSHQEALNSILLFLENIKLERESLALNLDPRLIMESLYRIIKKTQIMSYLNRSETKRSEIGLSQQIKEHKLQLEEKLNQFFSSLMSSYDRFNETESQSFLDYFLSTYNEDNPILETNLVNISTVHTAKGLEFPVVFISGCKASFGSTPYWSTIFSEVPADEEKSRLFYVAVTRASHLLYVGTNSKFFHHSKDILSNFTWDLPKLQQSINSNGSLIDNIAINLGRQVNFSKIRTGRTIQLSRSFHTICKNLIRRIK